MDVINLVSSDEEEGDGDLRGKIKSSKNISIKKIKSPQVLQLVKDIHKQKITPPIVHPKNNNHKVTVIRDRIQDPLLLESQKSSPQPRTHTPLLLKNAQSTPKTAKLVSKNQQSQQSSQKKSPQLLSQKQSPQWMVGTIKSKGGTPRENKKPTLNIASGITITPLSRNAIITNNHGHSTSSTMHSIGSVTIKPRTDKVIVPTATIPTPSKIQPTKPAIVAISKPVKRIAPTKISDTVMIRASSIEKSSDSDMLSRDSSSIANDEITPNNQANGTKETAKKPIHEIYLQLIEVCRNADPTEAMKKVIAKLEKYYHRAHTPYVNSKCFHKLVQSVIDEIKATPKVVYIEINRLLSELKTRKATDDNIVSTDENVEMSEADERKAKHIHKLNKALQQIQHKIHVYEEAEVDLDDELNSKYLMTERLKKRACDIYEKICDLTGENKNAERIVRKPIRFTGTKFPEFDRKLEKFINKTKSFPDIFDVLRIFDHCSKQYNYRMSKKHREMIAQEAFTKVGQLLQKRRKADLYEMVQYFSANRDDPAGADPALKCKLEENQRYYNDRMKEVIDKFTMHDEHSNDDNDGVDGDSPVKIEPAKSVISTNVPSASSQLIEPTIEPPELNLTEDIDMLNDSVQFVSDSGDFNDISKSDSILLEEPDMVHELEEEFLPTITSVTSLHPSEFNDLMNFELTTNQMESPEIS